MTRPARCGTGHLGSKGSLSPRCQRAKVGTITGGKPAGRRLVWAPGPGRRPGRQRPARVRVGEPSCKDKYDGSDPPDWPRQWSKRGGSLPSFPSPLARLGSSGLARKTRTGPAITGKVGCDPHAPIFVIHPPLTGSQIACPAPCPAPCHGTARNGPDSLQRKHPPRLG